MLADHFAAAMAGGAGDGTGARLGALAGAAMTLLERRHLDFSADPEHRILEADLEIVADILAALRPIAAPLASTAAEKIAEAEEVAQDIGKIGEGVGIETTAPGAGRTQALMTETIIGGALLRIAQDAVSLGGLLE